MTPANTTKAMVATIATAHVLHGEAVAHSAAYDPAVLNALRQAGDFLDKAHAAYERAARLTKDDDVVAQIGEK